jgi:hypothetical protein
MHSNNATNTGYPSTKPAEPTTMTGKAKETATNAWEAAKLAASTVRDKTVYAASSAKAAIAGRADTDAKKKGRTSYVHPTADNFSTEHPVIITSGADVPRSAAPQNMESAPAVPASHA